MSRTAVIAGLGPGFGERFAWRLAEEGYAVAVCSRSEDYLESFATELREAGHDALGVSTDITDPAQVERSFDRIREELGPISFLSVQASGEVGWGTMDELTHEGFKAAWEVYAYGPFLCTQQVLPDMEAEGGGTVLYVGATPRMGRGVGHGYVSARGATYRLADTLARELWPKGIHVAHVAIDGRMLNPDVYEEAEEPIVEEEHIDPDAAVDACMALHDQDPTAWSLDIAIRPNVMDFEEATGG